VFLADFVRLEELQVELGQFRAEGWRQESTGEYQRVNAVQKTECQAPQHGVQGAYGDPGPESRQHEACREKRAEGQDGSFE